MANLGSMYATLGVKLDNIQATQDTIIGMLKRISDEAEKTKSKLKGVKDEVSKSDEPFRLFSKKTEAYLGLVSQRIRTVGYLFSATLTAPMTMAGKSVAKMATEYEYSMQKIVGLTGTAQNVVNQWNKDIQKMSVELGRGPQELAEGIYFIASSGIHGAQALDVLEKSAKAAAAGLGDTQDMADYLTSVLNAYRGTGLTAAYATDVLVAAVREGKAEASGFAAAMGSITPLAANLGVSIDQVAGAMAAITLTGSTSAQAATYLRGVFNVLMKETKQGVVAMDEATEALGMMKISYEDLRTILREQGIMALMEKLNELTEGYGETLVSKVFPNIRAMLGVLSLSGKNMQYNSEIMKEITDSTGALSEAFAAVAETIRIRYDKALSKMRISMINLGKHVAEVLLPLLEKVVNVISKVSEWFDNLSEEQRKNVIKWTMIIAAVGPAALLLSAFGYTLLFMVNTLNGVTGALVGFSKVITGMSVATVAAEAATVSWTAQLLLLGKSLKTIVLFFVTNPFGIIITALTTGIVLMTKKIREMKKEMKELEDALSFTTPEMELDTKIGNVLYKQIEGTNKYVSTLKDLSQEELRETLSMVEQRIMAEKDKLNRLRTIQEGEIKNEEKISKLKQEIWEKEDVIWTIRNRNNPNLEKNKAWIRDLQKEIDEANVKIAKYNKESSYDKTAAESNLNYYEKVKKSILYQLKLFEKQEQYAQKRLQQSEEILKIQKDLEAGRKSIEKMFEWGGGTEMEKAQQFASLYDGIVKRISEIDELSPKIPWVKEIIDDWNKWKEVASDTNKLLTDMRAELAAIDMKKFLLGDSYDAESEKLQVYKKSLDELLDKLSKKDLSKITFLDEQEVKRLVGLIGDTQRVIEAITDIKTINLLNAEADAFGNISGKVEVLNYALQAQRRLLRDMLKKQLSNEFVPKEQIQRAVRNIQALEGALVDLQEWENLKFLEDMNRHFHWGATGAELLAGRISALQKRLEYLSKLGPVGEEAFKITAKQLQDLKFAQMGLNFLENSFDSLIDNMVSGTEDWGQVFKNILGDLTKEMLKFLAKMILYQTLVKDSTTGTMELGKVWKLTFGDIVKELTGVGAVKTTSGIGTSIMDFINDSRKQGPDLSQYLPPSETLDETISKYTKLNSSVFGYTSLLNKLTKTEKAKNDTIIEGAKNAKIAEQAAIGEAGAEASGAVASATKQGAKMPFPYNLIAITLAVGAVMSALALMSRARSQARATRMATGGVVPEGFPNDTFPALLSSGETVIPKKLSQDYFRIERNEEESQVRFVIEGETLVGILKKKYKKSSIY